MSYSKNLCLMVENSLPEEFSTIRQTFFSTRHEVGEKQNFK
ncbi:hypothetical protein [Porphyromonas macacae]|nr:hypothetical protein [Porphyromonas macacae]